MPVPLHHLFNPEDITLEGEGSSEWNKQVFQRAYCGQGGPFDKVCERLALGFSVLAYVPGNCMTAAAEFVKSTVGSKTDWSEHGKHPGGKKNILEVWQETGSMVDKLVSWLTERQGGKPNAIFHNLDLLSDGRGGVYPHPDAQTALFSLIASTRLGVVLGLSDRDAGKLPERIESAFSEKAWIDEIPFDRFPYIIPWDLGEKLIPDDGDAGVVPDGAAWLIASRLRWIDPLRAVKIMQTVANHNGIKAILKAILAATRTVEFLDPDDALPGQPSSITGFQKELTLDRLQNDVIRPYQRWATFTGTKEECERELRNLQPGVVLFGPPGTGKTLLARWVAKSIGLPVRTVSAADIKAGLFGEAEKNVHRLFRDARRAAPCVVVLDDADDLLPDRASVQGSVAGAERGIVHAALQELEGMKGHPPGVLVIMTTNRFTNLDQAAKRRLPLHVPVPYPLDDEQVGAIVDSIAAEYRFDPDETDWRSKIRSRLIDRFMGPIVYGGHEPITTREERLKIERNLFSPSEIQQAMRLLLGGSDGGADTKVRVTEDDVQRMETYYEQLAVALSQKTPIGPLAG